MATTSTINAVQSSQGGTPLTISSAFNQAIKSDLRFATSVYRKRYVIEK